jgi:hypothetical protein
MFVEELATCYNSACTVLKMFIEKVTPNSILLKRSSEELDPT